MVVPCNNKGVYLRFLVEKWIEAEKKFQIVYHPFKFVHHSPTCSPTEFCSPKISGEQWEGPISFYINAERNSERIIDIDILSIECLIYENNSLKIPHPLLNERLFVLKPWNDIACDFLVINENKTVNEFLEKNFW